MHQLFNREASRPLIVLSAQNRVFRFIGYDSVVHLEDAPEYGGKTRQAVAAD